MEILKDLITDESKIVKLTPKDIDNTYFFKKDDTNEKYPYYIADELVGSYFAKARGLDTVNYEIANFEDDLGLASKNFIKDGYKYEKLDDLIDNFITYMNPYKLDMLLDIPEKDNRAKFKKQLFNLFALDIHMLQQDRGNSNLQFKTNISTNEFSLAPLYDFSNCLPLKDYNNFLIPSKITRLDYDNIIYLAKKYPDFKEALLTIFDEDMATTWMKIASDYKFDFDSMIFEDVLNYYKNKEREQKDNIYKIFKRI